MRLYVVVRMVLAMLAIPIAASARDFTFRDAEFQPVDRGIEAAQAFIAERLMPGIDAAEARLRLRRAGMRCGKPRTDLTVACDFAEVVHVEGGTLGETHWAVVLAIDPAERLVAATLDHYTIGSGAPGL